jgi:hypothetical protein
MVFLSRMSEKTLRGADYFFPPQSQDPQDLLPLTLLPPTINSLREGLKTDRAVFLRSADYLETLPATTPADMALTRLLGNKGDAEWFARHVGQPQNTRDLAAILRQGAEQIALLEQKTYLSGPAWRQWLSGDVDLGLGPALKGSLNGMREFEKTRLEYQLSLAFLKASSAYRQAGQEGMRNIPDPASPGSFLSVSRTPEGLTLSSAYRREDGTNYSFTFQPAPAP